MAHARLKLQRMIESVGGSPISHSLLDEAIFHSPIFRKEPGQALIPRTEQTALSGLQPNPRSNAGFVPRRVE
jgi:hypothetical protein